MNLQHLRHFVTLAEEAHFGRAARRLNMTQPPLSQSLARLEASLGFRLIDRTRRRVALTPAGEAFLREVRPVLARLDRAVRLAREAHAGVLTQIKIGFVSSAVNDIIPRALAALAEISPQCEVQLKELSSEEQFDQILDGQIDMGFVIAWVRHEPDIQTRVVARYQQLAALPVSWPLTEKDELAIEDLKGLPFIAPPHEFRSDLQAVLEAECRRRGFTLRFTQEISRSVTALGLVGAGMGMTLAADAAARRGFPGVAFRPLQGLPTTIGGEVAMAWLPDLSSGQGNRLINALADALAV